MFFNHISNKEKLPLVVPKKLLFCGKFYPPVNGASLGICVTTVPNALGGVLGYSVYFNIKSPLIEYANERLFWGF